MLTTPEELYIGVGDRYILPEGSYFETDDDDICGVTEAGVLIARNEGECDITVTVGDENKSCHTIVTPAPERVTLTLSSGKPGIGENITAAAFASMADGSPAYSSYTFSSSDRNVASVNKYGEITAKKRGSATITVKTYNGLTAKAIITVKKQPTSIKFRDKINDVTIGESVIFKIKLSSGAGSVITYKSSDDSVATVDAQGHVTGISKGQAVISATTYNGFTARQRVFVCYPAEFIYSPESIEFIAGQKQNTGVTVIDTQGEIFTGTVRFSCEEKLFDFDGSDAIPLKAGSGTITVRSGDKTAEIKADVQAYRPKPVVIAHRGGASGVENTLQSISNAVEKGADLVEIDVRETIDGKIVLMHDDSLLRSFKRAGRVSALTLIQLKMLSLNGATIPTLDEVLTFLSGTGKGVFLELKSEGLEEKAAQAVLDSNMTERTVFIAFDKNALKKVKSVIPDAKTGLLVNDPDADLVELAKKNNVTFMLPKYTIINESTVSRLHAMGVNVGIWTPNTLDRITIALETGADAIITDNIQYLLGE